MQVGNPFKNASMYVSCALSEFSTFAIFKRRYLFICSELDETFDPPRAIKKFSDVFAEIEGQETCDIVSLLLNATSIGLS
jgi:hypothetical protein